MYDKMVLDTREVMAMMEAMLDAARRLADRPMGIAVVDDRGELLAFALMDGGTPMLRHYAIRKAYTASRMGQDVRGFAEYREQAGRQVADFGDPKLVGARRGGVVVREPGSGRALGGIGVSGGTSEEDEEVARTGLGAVDLS